MWPCLDPSPAALRYVYILPVLFHTMGGLWPYGASCIFSDQWKEDSVYSRRNYCIDSNRILQHVLVVGRCLLSTIYLFRTAAVAHPEILAWRIQLNVIRSINEVTPRRARLVLYGTIWVVYHISGQIGQLSLVSLRECRFCRFCCVIQYVVGLRSVMSLVPNCYTPFLCYNHRARQ